MNKEVFQWQLWTRCNSSCLFCMLGEQTHTWSKERQLTSLNDLDIAIDNLDLSKYDTIGIIGGEFFQGQLDDKEIYTRFFQVFEKIFLLYKNKKIDSIWITASLNIGNQKHLHQLLNMAENLGIDKDQKSNIWICTSWDSKGRFHTENMKHTWEANVIYLTQKYKWINVNTTIILQQDFIEKYIRGEFNPKQFMKKFCTSLFYMNPYVLSDYDLIDDNLRNYKIDNFDKSYLQQKEYLETKIGYDFFPKRKDFLKFLTKYYLEDNDTYNKLFNIKYRSDEVHININRYNHDKSIKRYSTRLSEDDLYPTLECGHSYIYASYSDSNKCCLCDKINIER